MREVVLITGANGFLARAVIRRMPGNWQFVALVRPGTTSSHFATIYDSVDQLISDLDRISVVIHLAACIPSPLSAAPPELTQVNVNLVAKLAHAYPDARHVLASSVSIYGVPTSLPLTIDSFPCRPNAYGLSKLAAESLVRQMPKHAIIRFSSLIGVGMRVDSFIPAVVSAARAGKIRLLGNGERLQNYLDIDDAALMCVCAATSKESFTALGVGERSYSNNEVATILAELTTTSIFREGNDQSPSYVYDFHDSMDIGRRRINLKESLEKMVQQT